MHFSSKDESLSLSLSFPERSALGIGLVLIAFYLLELHPLALAQQNASEDQVKAAYLLNFARLAEWPRAALADGPSPLVIGVRGGDRDFLEVLEAMVAGKIVGTHRLVVKPISSENEMKSCQIIFFRASEKKHAQAAMESMAPAGMLFVGEEESFLRQGGMVNLVREHGNIRFEVNPEALDRSGILFSAKILAMAKVGSGPSHDAASNSASETPRQEGLRHVEHSVKPDYPEIAQRMKLTGIVQVEALVKPDGTVKEVRVVGGHPLLVDALVQAVRQWRYQPAPKETLEVIKFNFVPQ